MKYLVLVIFLIVLGCGPDFEGQNDIEGRVDTLNYDNVPYSDFLKGLPCETEVEYKERIISTDDNCKLYVREMGEGEPILFLHGGWGHDLEPLYWSFRGLAEESRLIFYDQRGSLRSRCQSSDEISVESHVSDMELIINELGLENVTIVAHSMGGYLAQRYLYDHGHANINGMLLLGTLPPKFSMGDWLPMRQEAEERIRRPEVVQAFQKAGLDSVTQDDYTDKERSEWGLIAQAAVNLHDISRWPYFRGAFGYQESTGQRSAITMEQNFSCPGFLEEICAYLDMRFFRSWDFREALAQADFPVYYIHGKDDFLDYKIHIKGVKKAPNTYLKVIPKAGHLIWIDQPEVISDLMVNLLRKAEKDSEK